MTFQRLDFIFRFPWLAMNFHDRDFELFLQKPGRPKVFFQFEVTINALVSSFLPIHLNTYVSDVRPL